MRRIYDAAFVPSTNGSHHSHLGTFWWVDKDDSNIKGVWHSREEAHEYVRTHYETVYVSEPGEWAWVYAYHSTSDPSVKWIQTEADGKLPDNLITLAKRHAQGLRND